MNTTTQLEKPPQRQLTIRDRLESDNFKSAVAKALPKHLTPDRFIRVACTAMTKTPKLADCDQTSFFNCLLTLSQLGLEPDGRRAHLIPFENRKRGVTECQLIVDYKGLAELVMRSGLVSNLHADVVCDKDDFEYDRGQLTKHKINFREPRGPVYAVYCIARFKDGSEKCDVMHVDEVEAIRSRSRAAQAGPWVTDWKEMGKKTVFRRLSKWLPLSPEVRDAIDADDDTVIDIEPSQPLEVQPVKTKPRLGRPPKAPEEKPQVEAAEPEQAAAAPADSPGNPDDNNSNQDGDLGPQIETPAEFVILSELKKQLEGFEIEEPKFRRWAAESGWDKKFLTDPEAASKELIGSRSFKNMMNRVGTYTE